MRRPVHGRRTLSSIFSRGWQQPIDAKTTPGCVGRFPARGTEPGGPRDIVYEPYCQLQWDQPSPTSPSPSAHELKKTI
jgi:hypothetical protein